MAEFLSHGEKDTVNFGKEYARALKAGDVVLLEGDLGAGKTQFTKGVAKGLGIADEILSPTYAYMNDYYGKLYHFDCYRLRNGQKAEELGLTDYFYAGGVCVVEWAENIADVLPEKCKRVKIEILSPNERLIIYE